MIFPAASPPPEASTIDATIETAIAELASARERFLSLWGYPMSEYTPKHLRLIDAELNAVLRRARHVRTLTQQSAQNEGR